MNQAEFGEALALLQQKNSALLKELKRVRSLNRQLRADVAQALIEKDDAIALLKVNPPTAKPNEF